MRLPLRITIPVILYKWFLIQSVLGNVIDEDRLFREQYAKKMISFMNRSIDPCDDFYEYACGNWKNTLVKRHSERRRNNVMEINFYLSDMIENIIKNPVEEVKTKYFNEIEQARTFYESCLQANLYPLKSSNEYLEVIKNISGFPAIDENWNSDDFDWFNATAHLSVYGVAGFVKEETLPIHPFVPFFRLPELGFDIMVHSYNIRSNTTRAYLQNEQRMRQYLNVYGVDEANVVEIISAIFELWYTILKVTDAFNEDLKICARLSDETKWRKWKNYFEIVWNGVYIENAFSECPCVYFYKKLDEICNERKEAVANYLALKFLYHMDARLTDNAGKKDYCNIRLLASMKLLIDQLYMAQSDLQTEIQETALFFETIRSVMREKLEELSWLDNETREKALSKESALTINIGRSEAANIMAELIATMKDIQIELSNYERNNVEMWKHQAYIGRYFGLNHKNISTETKPFFTLNAMQMRATYNYMDNTIYIKAGFLSPPGFHKAWPLALKYGTIGYVIGHELSHGFDVAGAKFDSKGKYNPWWSAKSFTIFHELTKCYIDMFSHYEIPEIQENINGNRTKNENIADHAGLRLAFHAYQRHIQNLDKEDVSMEYMPGLDIRPEQLYYLGFAQLWCADYKENDYWFELESLHTIEKYRVLGTLSNMKEFVEAFKCVNGSKMNPTVKKCELW